MRLNPKEILPTVVGTVLVLTVFFTAISPKFASSSPEAKTPQATACHKPCPEVAPPS